MGKKPLSILRASIFTGTLVNLLAWKYKPESCNEPILGITELLILFAIVCSILAPNKFEPKFQKKEKDCFENEKRIFTLFKSHNIVVEIVDCSNICAMRAQTPNP